MDVEEIEAQACKYSRVGNGSSRNTDHSNKLVVHKGGGGGGGGGGGVEQYPDDEDQDGEIRRNGTVGYESATVAARLRGWHNSSRIFRVSRASGGKDRHSKVLTSKGLRDRRVRLSVSTAIAFYDLQDRLGYDQPSKAVEWLIKAAEEDIAELPSLNSPFPDTLSEQLTDGKRERTACTEQEGFDLADVELDGGEYPHFHNHHQQRQLSLSKSGCSSNSETSKGSGLSLSRSDVRVNRVKARERARERAAKEKENVANSGHLPTNNNVDNPISQNSSFTELLTCGISSVSNNNTSSTSASAQQSPGGGGDDGPSLFHKSARQWPPSTPMDCFNTGIPGSSRTTHHSNSGFAGQMQLGSTHLPQSMIIPPFAVAGENHHHHHNHHPPELQHFSFMHDHLIPMAASQPGGNENYNLNFTISSSGLAGLNRGTLQSNSSVPSMMPHFPRFSPIDGSSSNVPFFISAAAAAASPLENNNNNHHHHPYHQFAPGFDGRLQLYHGDGTRHSDQKGKGKN